MRVTDITLHANDEEIAAFSFRDPRSTQQYIAKTIIGLDAPEIVSKFYGFGLVTGKRYFDTSLKAREIVMRIALNPRWSINETYSNLRDDLYRAMSADRTGKLELQFHSGAVLVATLDTFITKVEVPLFSKIPEMQLTMSAPNPLLRAANPVVLETGMVSAVNPVVIADSLSTAPHGFRFVVKFTAASTAFIIQDSPTPDWKFHIIPGTLGGLAGFQINDELHFSSDHNSKHLFLRRGSTDYNLVDKIQPNSMWPVLFPGQNTFHIVSSAFTWVSLEYYAAYWGV